VSSPPRGLLLDIDGTLLDSGRAIPGAAEAVAALRARGVPLLFATNTSRKSCAAIAESLRRAGIEAEDREILSASAAAAARLRADRASKVCALLAPAALPDWEGFELVNSGAEAVVVGDMGTAWTYELLNTAFGCLHEGARLVATHKNPWWKDDDGRRSLDAGPFVAALEYASGVEAELVGKPAPGFFRAAAELLGLPPEQLAIIGDDLDADVGGGRGAGLATFAVRTGKFRADRLAAIPAARAPHHVLDTVRNVVEFFPA